MKTRRLCIMMCTCLLLTILGCGPDNIFIRQGLDTPSHHVDNGNQFMSNGKLDAASNEFSRALELDPNYAPAYVGLALLTGRRGDPQKGLAIMEKARALAQDEEQHKQVAAGFQTLQDMAAKD